MSDRVKDQQVNKDFGMYVRRARHEKGYTQKEVASMLGISYSFYNFIERGLRNISLELAVNICRLLGADISEFMKTQSQSNNTDN